MYRFGWFSTISSHFRFLLVSLHLQVERLKFDIKPCLLETISLELRDWEIKGRHVGASIWRCTTLCTTLVLSCFV